MREVRHPYDAISLAIQGETVRLDCLDGTVVIMPPPPPGHLVVTLDRKALDLLRDIRLDDRIRNYRDMMEANAVGLAADLRHVLDQLPECLQCMDTGEYPVGLDWCKCPAGAAGRERAAAQARDLSDAWGKIAPRLQGAD